MNTCQECQKVNNNPRFCSRSCAAIYNNKKYPKRTMLRKCHCGSPVPSQRIYCKECLKSKYLNNKVICNDKYLKINDKYCTVCNTKLQGKQSLFCSQKCKFKTTNNRHQNYVSQQQRGLDRKIKLIQEFGSKCTKCTICSYDKNFSALEFHHRNPEEKSFNIDIRKCSNSTWDRLVEESKNVTYCVLTAIENCIIHA